MTTSRTKCQSFTDFKGSVWVARVILRLSGMNLDHLPSLAKSAAQHRCGGAWATIKKPGFDWSIEICSKASTWVSRRQNGKSYHRSRCWTLLSISFNAYPFWMIKVTKLVKLIANQCKSQLGTCFALFAARNSQEAVQCLWHPPQTSIGAWLAPSLLVFP